MDNRDSIFFEVIRDHLLDLTSEIVSAYVSNSSISVKEVSNLMQEVFCTLSDLSMKCVSGTLNRVPAVPIEESITSDYIICLEDGKKLKMLKRYLKVIYGLTPKQYRERWGLFVDYPMVAPNYSKVRRDLAVQMGLGRISKKQ